MRRRITPRSPLAAALAVSVLTLTACASQAGGEDQPSAMTKAEIYAPGLVGKDAEQTGPPADGGTLTVADYGEARSLDPTKTIPNGAVGGNALAAVYDVLMRYDPDSGEFAPWLARSLTSADNQTWTLRLREGVTFSDGTPLDAKAVVGSIGYYMKNNGSNTLLLAKNLSAMRPQGADTVVFELTRQWREFPSMLAGGPGMILAPAAYADPEDFKPVGAGPFVFSDYKPSEELVLRANESYWKGAPHLDGLRFVWLGTVPARDALASKSVDVAAIRDPQELERARHEGWGGQMSPYGLSSMLWINNRPGSPGEDLRVRQAINYAIDDDAFMQRVFGGAGMPTRNLFAESSRYYEDIDTADYDLDKAKDLLAQAKADGYDGKISYLGQSDSAGKTAAVTIEAMLETAGFEVEFELARSITDQVQRIYVDQDYELASSSLSLSDDAPFTRLYPTLMSDSPTNQSGYANPEMDRLITELQAAPPSQAKRILTDINRLWQETVPSVAIAAGAFFNPWQDNVHGIVPTSETILLFGDAWKS